MSGPEDKKLKDLLAKNNNSVLDDFEKEALEGFAMLENEQEALGLKAALDARIKDKLFDTKKKRSPFYWAAAAAMFLIMGLSAYFILSNETEITQEKNMAIVSPAQDKTPGNTTESSFEEKAAELKSPETVAQPLERKEERNKALTPIVTAEPSLRHQMADAESAATPLAESSTGAADEIVAARSKARQEEEVVAAKDKAKQEEVEKDAKETISASPAMAKNDNGPEGQNYKGFAAANAPKASEPKKKEASRMNEEKVAAQGAASDDRSLNIATVSLKGCQYPGGEKALRIELEKLLTKKGVNKAFEAYVEIVDHNGKTGWGLEKTEGLSEKEIGKINSIILPMEFYCESKKCRCTLIYEPLKK